MRFSTLTLLLSLTTSILSAPTEKRALKTQSYNQFQVSGGVAGNALAEVNAKFPVDQNNLAGVSNSDLQIIAKAAQVAEQAETATGGFNDAVDAAGIKTTAGTALQNGKIKNKVLKLQTDVLRLQIEQAQGDTTNAAQLAQQQTKLATNVKLDQAAAGQKSTAISFAG